jgi:RNA polymerase sigma-70 factor (ECF subfamily)
MEGMTVGTKDDGTETARIAEEAESIRRTRRGDREAFAPLVKRYQGRVYALALRFTGDPHQAEDLCQEAFVRAYRALGGFDTRYPFVNWLLRIATNACRSAVKRRRRTVPLNEATAAAAELPHRRESDEQVAAVKRAIGEALSGLEERKRTAILLLHQSERSYADIADIMELPIGTVKTLIHRARNEIRRVLAGRGLL